MYNYVGYRIGQIIHARLSRGRFRGKGWVPGPL